MILEGLRKQGLSLEGMQSGSGDNSVSVLINYENFNKFFPNVWETRSRLKL